MKAKDLKVGDDVDGWTVSAVWNQDDLHADFWHESEDGTDGEWCEAEVVLLLLEKTSAGRRQMDWSWKRTVPCPETRTAWFRADEEAQL